MRKRRERKTRLKSRKLNRRSDCVTEDFYRKIIAGVVARFSKKSMLDF